MRDLTVSIILCTYNRCSYLKKAVESLLQQTYPADDYEIVIVDNASTDSTRDYIEKILQRNPNLIRYVFEPILGTCHARNAGTRIAQGAILAYLDDDAVAEPGWLAALVTALKSDEHIVCVGGKVDLLWETSEPSWMPKELYSNLGDNTAWGDIPQELPVNRGPYELNMAIWKWAVQVAGGWNTHFGPVGGNLGRSDGDRLMIELRPMGKILYAPDAIVHHYVSAQRATKKYFIRLGFMQGIANADLMFLRNPRSPIGLIRSFIANIWFLAREATTMVHYWLQREQRKTFAYLVFIIIRLGQMWQTMRLVLGYRSQ